MQVERIYTKGLFCVRSVESPRLVYGAARCHGRPFDEIQNRVRWVLGIATLHISAILRRNRTCQLPHNLSKDIGQEVGNYEINLICCLFIT